MDGTRGPSQMGEALLSEREKGGSWEELLWGGRRGREREEGGGERWVEGRDSLSAPHGESIAQVVLRARTSRASRCSQSTKVPIYADRGKTP